MTATLTKPRLKAKFDDEIVAKLTADLGIENRMQVPTLDKIVVNIGLGEAVTDGKALDAAMADLAAITGQQPQIRRAKKSIANFKLREGMPIGLKVTMRGPRMWEFFDRLVTLALPRIRDFRGLNPKSFDGNGNYTFGLTEQLVFLEVDYDSIDNIRGMDITLVTTTKDDAHARALLDAFNFPFKKKNS